MSDRTLYWHDYETFGTDPRRDRPAQFAGVRTDEDLNLLGDSLVLYCKPADDMLPQPDSCLITGITPQIALEKGVNEAEFIARVHEDLARPGTCGVGYNSIRFDDEVTRNTLYRNFFDPYAREWQNGNSRWDIIDLVRLTRALRPEGIQWPVYEDGKPCFKLEELTAANGIQHESAHDALSDVYATLAVARLIRQVHPKLYDYVYRNRDKRTVNGMLDPNAMHPVLHVSGRYPSERGCIALVVPLCRHPINSNGIIVYDLSVDPGPMLSLSPAKIHERIFTATADLPDNVARIPLKTVHTNKCPVIVPVGTMRPADAKRLRIDLTKASFNLKKIRAAGEVVKKIRSAFEQGEFTADTDPDLMLYSGGFFGDGDKALSAKVRSTPPERLGAAGFPFQDPRLPEMLFRYRARNFPATLGEGERERWYRYKMTRLTDPAGGASITLEAYRQRLETLRADSAVGQERRPIINDLAAYADAVARHGP